ncbi:hypothetical protein LHA31_05420 [Carnobacterium viridans]|nr:hypothetical protein [Carnobacterium viridans]UDE96150.1 hypothetical protein LHA31_05420 [Carnobacterium viridans]
MNQEQMIRQKIAFIFPSYASPIKKQNAIDETEKIFRTLAGKLAEQKKAG